MNQLTTGWKIFRIICIVQLVLVAFQGMLTISRLFTSKGIVMSLVELLVYTCVFVFVYDGLSMLNYNFPDIPLSPKQKRSFNLLYLLNFLFIAFLFARVVNTWGILPLLFGQGQLSIRNWFLIIIYLISPWFVFFIHLVFLAGMFRLRRLIHKNTISGWYQQFDKKPE
jgi:hypothetical protein